MRHLKKYLLLNIYDTIYYIDIIFSKINKKYLSLDYIFTINKFFTENLLFYGVLKEAKVVT